MPREARWASVVDPAAVIAGQFDVGAVSPARLWVPTRAEAAGAPGGSGWIPASRSEAPGPPAFLLEFFGIHAETR